MKTKATSTALLLTAVSLACSGCIGTTLSSPEVRGRVVDATTKKPIPAATVQVAERTNTKVHTDANGGFRVPTRSSFHLGFIPGPCAWTYFPAERPYSDELVVAHPDYRTREFPAHTLSVTHASNREPDRITTADIGLQHK